MGLLKVKFTSVEVPMIYESHSFIHMFVYYGENVRNTENIYRKTPEKFRKS